MIVAFFILQLVLFATGMPIVLAIAAVITIYLWGFADIPLVIIPQQTVGAMDSFLLLAIPMFLLTGGIMTESDVTRRLVRFSQSIVGWMRGGIGQVNVLTNIFMAGISGSGLADAAATGSALIPVMKRSGYGAAFSAVLTNCAACIGPIIPPSIIMVLIGGLTSVSIARMFLGGVVPGLLFGLFIGAVVYFIARRRNYTSGVTWSVRETVVSFFGALPSLGLPVIIVGGILFGVFTPTESAGVAAAYTIGLGLIYRKLTWATFYRTVVEVGITTATVMFVVGISGILGWVLISENVGQSIAAALSEMTTNKTLMLLLIVVALLVLGCFMESLAILILAVPVLMPLVEQIGIDPVQFGVVATIALTMGLITPPFGLGLFLMCRMAGVKIEEYSRELIPFLVAMLAVLLLLILFPDLVVWLPDLMLGKSG